MDEKSLAEKLRRIETLFAGAATPGKRQGAAEAAQRITARLEQVKETDPAIAFQFSMPDH